MNLLRHPRLAAAIMSTTVTASSPPAAAAATTASATLASAASAPASDSDSATAAAAAAAEVPELQLDQPPPRSTAWWRWTVATREHQLYYQRRLLRPIPDLKIYDVPVRDGHFLHTLELGAPHNPPLLLVHGLGAGAASYVKNIPALAARYHVYAIDLPGFAASSRPAFDSSEPGHLESQFVDFLDDWRQAKGLGDFVLLGHSFGGYLAAAYALKHPQRIKHLVLADPWGFPARPTSKDGGANPSGWRPNFALRTVASVLSRFPPYAILRVAGPWGPSLLQKARPDLARAFDPSGETHQDLFGWMYHSNALPPSGELAFQAMSIPFGWARRPMIDRITEIDEKIPMTFIYGGRSFISSNSGYRTQQLRQGKAAVDVHILPNSGHHVMWDSTDGFNELVLGLADQVVDSSSVPATTV